MPMESGFAIGSVIGLVLGLVVAALTPESGGPLCLWAVSGAIFLRTIVPLCRILMSSAGRVSGPPLFV